MFPIFKDVEGSQEIRLANLEQDQTNWMSALKPGADLGFGRGRGNPMANNI